MSPKKIAAFALGPLGGAVLAFITLPIITWFFSPEDIGRIAMLQITVSFSVLLFGLGLDQAYVREYYESKSRPALLKATMFPGFLLLTTTSGLILIMPHLISNLLFEVSSIRLSILTIICLQAAFISRFLSLVLRMQERGIAFSLSQLLPKLLFIVIIGTYIMLNIGYGLFELVSAHTASIVLVCIILSWNTRKEWLSGIRQITDAKMQTELLRYGFPLILGGVAFWGLTATDKVFLRIFSTFEELGIYSVSVSFAGAATILQSLFSTVWMPTVYKWASQGKGLEKIQQITRYVLVCVLLIFCLAGMFSWVVDFILPKKYENVKYILVACLGYPLLYTLSETTVVGINLVKKTSYAMTAAVIAFMLNVIGNYFLIPSFGAAGAAVSTGIAFWAFLVLRTEFSIFLWKKIPRMELYIFTFAAIMLSSTTALQGSVLGWWAPTVWVGAFLIVIIWFFPDLKRALNGVRSIGLKI